MKNRIITMESLVEFCKSQGTFSYDAKETGHPLVVSTYGKLEYSNDDDDGLMRVHLKACHTGLNRNGSHITNEDMGEALPSLANKPILAEITTNSKGELDFGEHAIEETKDEDGNKKYHYIEQAVGITPESCNAHLEYDEQEEKDYVHADGYIFTLYGNETADILKRRGGTDCSVELDISEFAWDAKNKWLSLKKFIFNGITLLGEDFLPGMKGARCELSDFSQYSSHDYSKELNEMKSRLAILEQRFSNKNSEEGGNQAVDKLHELLAQYDKTLEDLDFEYEGLSDEELEAKFAEKFAEGDDNTPSDGEGGSEGNNADDKGDSAEDKGEDNKSEEPKETSKSGAKSGDSNDDDDDDDANEPTIPLGQVDDDTSVTKKTSEFALSLQEKIKAIANLVAVTYEEADNEWYSTIVYDNYCIMIGWFGGQAYKQSYKADGDEYVLVGDRVQVYEQYLTQEEIDALESMKSEFAELKEFKANLEQKNFEDNLNNLIEDERFDSIRETEEFKAVVKDAKNYTLEELETKFKLIFADIELANRNYVSRPISEQKGGKMFSLPSKNTNPVESKYGGIFLDK